MDPQARSPRASSGRRRPRTCPPLHGVGLFDDAFDPSPTTLIRPTPFERIRIVAGSNALDEYNVPRPHEAGKIQLAFRGFLKEARGRSTSP